MTSRFDAVHRSTRVVFSDGIRAASVAVQGGKIASVHAYDERLDAATLHDHGDCHLLPGLVDTHAHINEPGRTEWEGFVTATRAAAAGGITTVVDMPLNSIPPTVDRPGLSAKQAASAGKLWVDVGLWGGVVPGNTGELSPLFQAGLPGFKCFLVPSGVDEFPHVERSDLLEALPVIAELGAVLLVHAEVPGPIEAAERAVLASNPDPRKYSTYLSTRPPAAEREAIELCVELCRQTGARVHIVHFACGDAVDLLRAAKQEGLPFSAETCPHYLYFEAETIPDGNTAYKCAPPIREARHGAALRAALADGSIDFLVSDHSPCVPQLKQLESGSFLEAWGGIASLQLGLSIAHTLCQQGELSFAKIAEWMCAAPARVAGLSDRKGAIAPGLDADFAVFDVQREWVVRGAELAQRHPTTPYEGHTLTGRVVQTFLRGSKIYDAGQFSEEPQGSLVAAGAPV